MQPRTLHLKNVFQHEDLTLDFTPGITGVIGRNGSGKSNLLEALYFALTGKTSSGLVKGDLQMWDRDKGSTTLAFEHNGKDFELIRNIHNTSCWLRCVGEKDLKNAEVNAMMEDIFGMDADSLYETCWTPQGGLVTVLTMTHASRVAFFQRLAGIRKAETLRGIIQERGLNRLPPLINRDAEIRGLQASIQTLSQELMQCTEAQGKLAQIHAEFKASFPEVQRILGMKDEATYIRELKAAEDRLTEAQCLYDTAATQEIPKEVEAVQAPGAEVEEQRRQWMLKQQLEKTGQSLQKRIAELQGGERPPVEEPVGMRTDVQALRDNVQYREPSYKMAKARVCPTCRRPFEFKSEQEREDIIKEFEAAQATLQEQATILLGAEGKYNSYMTWFRNHAIQLETAKRDLETNRQDILNFGDIPFSEAEYLTQVQRAREYAVYLQRIQAARQKLKKLEDAVAQAKAGVQQATQAQFVLDTDRAKAKTFMTSYHELEGKIREVDSKISTIKAMVQAHTQQLSVYSQEQAVGRDIEKLRMLFDRAREILHRDYLPRLVMQKMLMGLNSLLDSYLAVFETNYTAYINEELEFICSFEHKSDVPARSLSGGQKVALALAFKFALTDLLAASVPVMVLDEPTVWLDDINKPKLAEVLQKARSVTEKGVYVLVATHEQELLPSFSRVLDISYE